MQPVPTNRHQGCWCTRGAQRAWTPRGYRVAVMAEQAKQPAFSIAAAAAASIGLEAPSKV